MPNRHHNYHIYITTNPRRTVLYTGVTNDLKKRLAEHWKCRGSRQLFTGKYCCYNLIYYEHFTDIRQAIEREKEIKGWRRQKKIELIGTMNPNWIFFNESVCDGWPPVEIEM